MSQTSLPPPAREGFVTESVPPDRDRLVGSDRVLAIVTELARYPEPVALDELARAVGSPKPTVHRALAALRRAGFAQQDGHGRYVLGDTFLRLAFAHAENRPDNVRVLPLLQRLARRYGETAHYAVLDGRDVVYRAKVDPPFGAIRLTTAVGGRLPAQASAAGKMLLALALPDDDAVRRWVAAAPLVAQNARTITRGDVLVAELRTARAAGFARDDQESGLGITCVAAPVFLTSSTTASGAVSISALAYRTPLTALVADIDFLRSAAAGDPDLPAPNGDSPCS